MSLQMQEEDFGLCPSFNSYSSGATADAARRASGEFSSGCSSFDFDRSPSLNKAEDQADDDDFEFVSLQKSGDSEVFRGGLIAPVFPVFDSELLFEERQVERAEIDGRDSAIVQPIQIPLEKLLIRDRDNDPLYSSSSSSSSSSSADELEGVPSGTYCVWNPKSVGTPNLACKKSRSTGSSSTKRWGILDLLRRSHSSGNHTYVSFTSSTSLYSTKKAKEIKSETKSAKELKEKIYYSREARIGNKSRGQRPGGDHKKNISAHESFYVRNRTLKEEGKRKSYLPYKLQAGIGWLLD
ncbi:uncharacterized protein LOC111481526 [Cucurbita maxima]|uniref:Uncharacterized protein LOC111481526 n=1 Tax=Cucurbita maxima TaxID=3661 RepID=A0A6J1J5P2_CUCMA|nr:uncharacterized protein LOC111481526 [Cucurbita maxima]